MSRKYLVSTAAVAALVVIPIAAAAAGPGASWPPSASQSMGAGQGSIEGGGAALPAVAHNVLCTVAESTRPTSPGWIASRVTITGCTDNGLPAAWNATYVKVDLQYYSRNDQAWLTATTGGPYTDGRNTADTVAWCAAYAGATNWRGRAFAAALVNGVPVSGGPWYTENTC
jgi:hypothetical protein